MFNSFVTPWTVALQAPLSVRFPRQEYWGGLPFPSPWDLPNPGVEPASTALAGGFLAILLGSPISCIEMSKLNTCVKNKMKLFLKSP